MTDKEILSKANEIHRELADKTGVNEADVAKVLAYLGLEGALSNRIAKPTSDPRSKAITLEDIRITAGIPMHL